MRLCARLGVKWVGLVFHPASPRFVTVDQAKLLHDSIPLPQEGGPLRVGLFVKPTQEQVEHTLNHVPLDILQLYTNEDQAQHLRKKTQKPVWLARGITSQADLPTNSTGLDGYIIEAPAQKGDTRPGGLGRTFDWSLTQNWQAPAPWLLAGGLTPDNVAEAIQTSQTPAVDVSSGVETAPALKSSFLIEKFIQKAHEGACLLKK